MIKVVTPEGAYYPHNGDQYWFQNNDALKIFLAGTIDNGDSDNWQDKLIDEILFYNEDENDDRDLDEDFSLGNLIIYNPRRDNWNSNASEKDIEEQIKWEQDHLDEADLIIMYLGDNSKSPISLLELGLYGESGKVYVFCTEKFYRFTNVKLTCEKYLIPLEKTNDVSVICSKLFEIYDEISKI